MDLKTIHKACTSSALKKHFLGILFSDKISIKIKNGNVADFYIVNTNHLSGEHWYTIIRGSNMWVIFDSTEFTPNEEYENVINSTKLPCIIDRGKIQSDSSLLCGEFALMATLLMTNIFTNFENLNYSSYPVNYYSKSIKKYVKLKGKSCNDFVYKYIYNDMKLNLHIKPECKNEVVEWLKYEI